MWSDTTSHKRKYGKKIGSIHTPKAVAYHEPTGNVIVHDRSQPWAYGGQKRRAVSRRRRRKMGSDQSPLLMVAAYRFIRSTQPSHIHTAWCLLSDPPKAGKAGHRYGTCWWLQKARSGTRKAWKAKHIIKNIIIIIITSKVSGKPYLIWEVIQLFLHVFSRPEGVCAQRERFQRTSK